MPDPTDREAREVEIGGRAFRGVVAWRGRGGWALAYFRPREEAGAPGDADRRAALRPGVGLAGLDEEELRELYRRGARLTVTERRFRAPDGRQWLVQSVGPVWAEGGAAGLAEFRFTSLEGPQERFSAPDGHAGRVGDDVLAAAWEKGRGRTAD